MKPVIFFENNKLIISCSVNYENKGKFWVAQLTAKDPVYKYQRKFIKKSVEGYVITEPGVYQIYHSANGETFDKKILVNNILNFRYITDFDVNNVYLQ